MIFSSATGKPESRYLAFGVFIVLWIFFAFTFLGSRHGSADRFKQWTGFSSPPDGQVPISYNLQVPPMIGCEAVVRDLQFKLIDSYSEILKGIRYANLWGYMETENKGDAAIWTAQQMLLSTLGISTLHSCRSLDKKNCDIERFNATLRLHQPHSAIIMSGGGTFNDYAAWEDHQSRIAMVKAFRDVPIRSFPQSVYMAHEDRVQKTNESFSHHPNLQLAARDQTSFEWLQQNIRPIGNGSHVDSVMVPDVAFMWGSRPDLRIKTKQTHDILILARADTEISTGNSSIIPYGTGTMNLGGSIGNITYRKIDWSNYHTPGIDAKLPSYLSTTVQGLQKASDFPTTDERGRNQRAYAKAIAGFELLASGRFVITDRLQGHVMSTVMGVPHVLMDSKLRKNLDLHNAWTQECECTRITPDFETSLKVARGYFESIKET